MPSNAVASTHEVAKRAIAQWTDSTGRTSVSGAPAESTDSLFERVAWLYAFCRERLFRDDTDRIISALWQTRAPASGTRVIELGCGPGFYSRKLARRFPQIAVTGVDRSENQLRSARQRAAAQNVNNCAFERVNALAEPRHTFWASIPLMAMWLLASVIHSGNGYREPRKATVLKTEAFGELFRQLPWKSVRIWQDGRYQYAVCEKS